MDESYFRKFHSDVFYLPSVPNGGFAIKKEYDQDCLVPAKKRSIKTENTLSITQLQSATMIALTPQEFIQKVIEATETEDINKIEKLNFVDELIDEIQSANPLAPIDYNEIAANAAMGGYEALANTLIEKRLDSVIEIIHSTNPRIPVDYNRIAIAAARGGQAALVDALFGKMLSANQRVNYDRTPQIPVNSDPHHFAPVLQFSKSSHSACTTLKEAQENQVNTVEQQVSTPCL